MEAWRIPDTETKWTVNHRYSDFAQLHAALKVGTLVLPQLPPKKVFGNTDRDFINERKVALQVRDVSHCLLVYTISLFVFLVRVTKKLSVFLILSYVSKSC